MYVSYDWECVGCGQVMNRLILRKDVEKAKKEKLKCPKCGGIMEWQFPGPMGYVH